jgi:hypothetical protein
MTKELKISGKNTRKTFNSYSAKKKTPELGTSHIIRKVPQSGT